MICHTVPRIHQLLIGGYFYTGFNEAAGARLRNLEGDLRDLLGELHSQGRFNPPIPSEQTPAGLLGIATGGRGPVLPGPPPKTPAPVRPPPAATGEGEPKAAATTLPLQLGVKARSPAVPVKTEPEEEVIEKPPLAEVESPVRDQGEERRGREVRRSITTIEIEAATRRGKRKRRRGEGQTRALPPKSKKGRRDRAEKTPPRKERKTKSPVEPEPAEERASSSRLLPREPSGPPPDRPARSERGTGWRGEVPRSSHFRWTGGKNKGIVKRAKQERYNRRRW